MRPSDERGDKRALSETIAVAQSIARRRFFDAGGMLDRVHANLRIEIAIVQTDLRHASLALDSLRGDLFAGVPYSLCQQVAGLKGDVYATRTQPVALPDNDKRPNQFGGVAIDLLDEQLSAVLITDIMGVSEGVSLIEIVGVLEILPSSNRNIGNADHSTARRLLGLN